MAANRPEGSSRANNKATAACAVLSVEMEREEMSALSVQVKGSKDWRVLALARGTRLKTRGAEGRWRQGEATGRVARMGGARAAVSTEERGGKSPGAAQRWDESGRAGTRVHGSG